MSDVYAQIAEKIINRQEAIIGPIALEQAKHVHNITIRGPHDIEVVGDGQAVIDELVRQYEHLFGRLSVEVCKDATSQLLNKLPPDKQPKSLKA